MEEESDTRQTHIKDNTYLCSFDFRSISSLQNAFGDKNQRYSEKEMSFDLAHLNVARPKLN